MIHFKDIDEVLNVLKDVQAYIFMQSKNDKLAELILTRIDRILSDNNVGDNNEESTKEGT